MQENMNKARGLHEATVLCAACAAATEAAYQAGAATVELCDACTAADNLNHETDVPRRRYHGSTMIGDATRARLCGACQVAAKGGGWGARLCAPCWKIATDADDAHTAELRAAELRRKRAAPCDPDNWGCECGACQDARPMVRTDDRLADGSLACGSVRFPVLAAAAVGDFSAFRRAIGAAPPSSHDGWRARMMAPRPGGTAPGHLLAAMRARAAVLLNDPRLADAVTEADLGRAESAQKAINEETARTVAARREEAMAEARKAWAAFTDEAPRIAAEERRDIVMGAYEAVIPDAYAGVIPAEAGADDDERRQIAAELLRPNAQGLRRLRSWSDYEAAMDAAVAIAEGRERTILLGGPTGAGKTTLAGLMLRMIALHWQRNVERGVIPGQRGPGSPPSHYLDAEMVRSLSDRWRKAPPAADGDPTFARLVPALPGAGSPIVAWTTARDIFRRQTEPRAFPKAGEEAADPLADIRTAKVLVIDEIGHEPDQKNILGVAEIVYDRHDAGLVTIVTTGWTDNGGPPCRENDAVDVRRFLAPMAERYGAAFVRRLSECTTLAIGFRREKGERRGPGGRLAVPEDAAPRRRILSKRGAPPPPVVSAPCDDGDDDDEAVMPPEVLAAAAEKMRMGLATGPELGTTLRRRH